MGNIKVKYLNKKNFQEFIEEIECKDMDNNVLGKIPIQYLLSYSQQS